MRNRGDDAAAAAASVRCCALAEDFEVQKKLLEGVTEFLDGVGVAVLVGGKDVETSSDPSNWRWVICGSAVM
jgi:hypothetical protein